MTAIRQLKLLAMLESRPEGLELDQASRELGVPRRTVYRDFEVLEQIGVPLISEKDGRVARWRIHEGYRHRLQLSLTWFELLGLLVARGLVAGHAASPFTTGLAAAVEKIRATLPPALAERFEHISTMVTSSPSVELDYSSRRREVAQLTEAIEHCKRVVGHYRSTSRRTAGLEERRLDPHHLTITGEGIYLIAFCNRSREMRTYRVDRFERLRVTGETFERAKDFDPRQFLAPMFGMWAGPARRVRFTVSAELAPYLMERKVHPSQRVQRRFDDGSAEVELKVAIGPPFVRYLASLGAAVNDIQPAELMQEVADLHLEAARKLGAGAVAAQRLAAAKRASGDA